MAAEKNFENRLKDYLTNIGAWYIKYWAGSKFTKEGIPDIIACYKGRFIAIEVKGKKGKPSLLQLVTLKKIRQSKGYGILLYPEDFDGFKKFIDGESDGFVWYVSNTVKQDKWFSKLST